VSVGHVQRAFETAGIPTVGVYVRSFGHIPSLMGVSRALVTNHPMGRPLGAPGDAERQRDVVAAALRLLTSDDPVVADFDEAWRPGPATHR
jgi:hypothetical protein